MDPQFAGVDAHIVHINNNIADIKTEQRRIDGKFDKKLDEMTPRLELLRDKIEASTAVVGRHVDDSCASLTKQVESVDGRVESVRKEMTAQVETARKDLNNTVENVRGELSKRIDDLQRDVAVVKESVANVKFWAYRFFVTQTAGVLVIIAHGFKWF
jgi:chromosome segregation ATPase